MDLKSPDTLLTNPKKNRFYSPLVRNIAKQEQIDLSELENITGSGKEDRLTKQDVLNYSAQGTCNQIPLMEYLKAQ